MTDLRQFKQAGSRVCIQEGCRFDWPEQISIGDGVHIGRGTEIQGGGGVSIGNNVVISFACVIWSVNHNYEADIVPYDYRKIRKPIVIEDNVWIGRNAIINGGVTIHQGAVIGMGSVVVDDVPPLAVVGGNPARVIKYRDATRYRENLRNGRLLMLDGEGCSACRGDDYEFVDSK